MSTELSVVKNDNASLTFGTKEIFEHHWRVSAALASSSLIPETYRGKPENCLIALEVANRLHASPLMVMQNLYIVHGKPAWSSQFLIATLNASGRYSSLKYEEDEKDGGRTRAYATEKSSGELIYGVWVSMKMAEAEGWVNKTGSKWKTMPEVMRRYRAASFFTKQVAPEISMGFMTEDEAEFTPYEDVKNPENANKKVLAFEAEKPIENGEKKEPEKTKEVKEEKKAEVKKDVKPNEKAKETPATDTRKPSEYTEEELLSKETKLF